MHADDEALVLHERASAAPYLANAPHEGPDEPLLLRHDAGNGVHPSPGLATFNAKGSAEGGAAALSWAVRLICQVL